MLKTYLFLILLTLHCPSSDERCASCFENKCRLCYDSYLDQSKTCQKSLIEIKNCLQYSTNGICKYCENGFNATSSGKCEKIEIEKCLIKKNSSECSQCEKGILVKNGKCDEGSKCLSKDCERCGRDEHGVEKCVLCKSGFSIFIDNGRFLCRDVGLQNCVYMSKDGTQECAVCAVNYYWRNGKCVVSSKYSLSFVGIFGRFFALGIVFFGF